jgi:hypothetical protein
MVRLPGPVVTNSNASTKPLLRRVRWPGNAIVEVGSSLTTGSGYSGMISPVLSNMLSKKMSEVLVKVLSLML